MKKGRAILTIIIMTFTILFFVNKIHLGKAKEDQQIDDLSKVKSKVDHSYLN
jgi:hypothetical protein